MICTTRKQAQEVAKKNGKAQYVTCIHVNNDAVILGTVKAAFWFANYETHLGKVGWTSEAVAHQILV